MVSWVTLDGAMGSNSHDHGLCEGATFGAVQTIQTGGWCSAGVHVGILMYVRIQYIQIVYIVSPMGRVWDDLPIVNF